MRIKKIREPTCEALDPISLAQVCKFASLQANAIFKSAKERKTIWQKISRIKKIREPTCEALDPISLALIGQRTRNERLHSWQEGQTQRQAAFRHRSNVICLPSGIFAETE